MYSLLPGGPWSLAFFTEREKEKTQINHRSKKQGYTTRLAVYLFISLAYNCGIYCCTILLHYENVISLVRWLYEPSNLHAVSSVYLKCFMRNA